MVANPVLLRSEWDAVSHEVVLLRELEELIGQTDVAHVVRARAAARARCDDAHAEAMRAPGDYGADAAKSHHQHGLAFEIGELRPRTLLGPASLLLLPQEIVQVAAQQQHHPHDVLR